jgi:hypothetical protein
MCQLRKLLRKCGVNDPVPDLVYVIDHDKITAIPAATTTEGTVYNTITTDVTLAPSSFWQRLEFRRRSANFKITDKGEQDANQYAEQELTAFYPESDEETMHRFNAAVGWQGIVAWLNGNNKKVLWGTLTNWVELVEASFDASKGGWDLKFIRMAPGGQKSPPFYTGAITEA